MKGSFISVITLLAFCACGPIHQNHQDPPQSRPGGEGGIEQPHEDSLGENGALVVARPAGKRKPDASCARVLALKSPGPLKSIINLKPRFLKAHNEVRKLYGIDGLEWDQGLANYAQAWANELKTKYNCRLNHRQNVGRTEGKKYGENLASYSTSKKLSAGSFASSPDFATNAWAKECDDWSYLNNSCAPGKVCGHLTQVIWQKSKKVGCGVAVCLGAMRTEVWVCNYDPPGNMTINGVKQRPF